MVQNQALQARAAARTSGENARRQRTGAAVQAFLRTVEGRAASAAALPQLRAQLALLRDERLDGELAATLADWFRSEPECEPFRREFPIYAVSADAGRAGAGGGCAGRARCRCRTCWPRRASGARHRAWSPAAERPLLVAAARVPVPRRAIPAVLVLARPMDGAALSDLSARSGDSLLLARER